MFTGRFHLEWFNSALLQKSQGSVACVEYAAPVHYAVYGQEMQECDKLSKERPYSLSDYTKGALLYGVTPYVHLCHRVANKGLYLSRCESGYPHSAKGVTFVVTPFMFYCLTNNARRGGFVIILGKPCRKKLKNKAKRKTFWRFPLVCFSTK